MTACRYPTNKATSGYTRGCRCDRCTAGYLEYHRGWCERNKATRLATQRAVDMRRGKTPALRGERHRSRNERSREKAKNHGKEWTGAEMELVGRQDLSLSQLAEMLGRTYSSVHAARKRIAHDPRAARLAGLARSSGEPS